MPEKIKYNPERHEIPSSDELLLPTPEQAEPLRKGEKDPAEALNEARRAVAETASAEADASAAEKLQDSTTAARPAPARHASRELKTATLKQQLNTVRHGLGRPGRAFSKVIHQPVIRTVSEPVAKTAARPSGLMGGGLVAFIGTTGYLYLAKHNGMTYNYFVFLGLLIVGFVAGLVLELFVHAFTRKRRKA